MSSHSQSQYSPSDKSPPYQKFSTSPIQTSSKDIFINDYSTGNDQQTNYHYYPLTPPISTHIPSSQTTISCYQRSRSPSMTPSNFIRVHFPNKHTTAVGQLDSHYMFFWMIINLFQLAARNDETLESALESRASRHSVFNLRSYTPVYMISR